MSVQISAASLPRVVLSLLFGLLLVSPTNARAADNSQFEVFDIGVSPGAGPLSGRGCWIDKSRFAFLQAEYLPNEQREKILGLYYLDVSKRPIVPARIDMSPIDPSSQARIKRISCQGSTIVVQLPGDAEDSTRLYGVRIGANAELLSEMRGKVIDLANGYVIGSSQIVTNGVYEGKDDCKIVYLKPGLKPLCWNIFLERRFWLFPRFVMGEYVWREQIKIRAASGKPEFVPNPDAPRVLDKDVPIVRYVTIPGRTDGARMIVREPQPPGSKGVPAFYAIVLYGFDQSILSVVDQDPVFKIFGLQITVNPSATYAFAPCNKKAESKYDLEFDGVCRYALDGKPNHWERVFSFDVPGPARTTSIQTLSISSAGDIAFAMPGTRYPNSGIWKFDAIANSVVHVTNPESGTYDEVPLISPDGRSIAFTRPIRRAKMLFVSQLR